MRSPFRWLLPGLLGLVAATMTRAEEPRPNILFLYTDDQARWGVGVYGNPEVQTPNLDRLAREGAIFQNAFTVTPVCSPSRAAMFSGLYPSRLGIEDWIHPQAEPDLGLAPAVIGWPELLRAHGYDTALLGKWHLGTRDSFHPTRQGFDLFFGFREGGNRPMNPRLEVEGQVRELKGSLPDLLTDRALAFLEQPRSAPFLLAVHFRAPHAPYGPVPEEDRQPFADLDPTIPEVDGLPIERVKRLTRDYYASIHSVDRNIGRFLTALDEKGLSQSTLVIFTSDHGYMIGHHGLWHKGNASWLLPARSGHRPNMFEESIRVPLIVRWPSVVESGTELEPVVSNLDLFPTILDLVGQGVPENLHLDGHSMAPMLRGEPLAWDDTLYGLYDMHHYQIARMRMVRTPDWKLIRHFEPGTPDELYHLAADPGEEHNLAPFDAKREIREELQSRMFDWMRRVRDPLVSPSAGLPSESPQ